MTIAQVTWAGDGSAPTPLIADWLQNMAFVLGIVYMGVKLLMYTRARPPYHQQFASIDHVHADLVTAEQKKVCAAEQTEERMTLRQDMVGLVEKVERQLDHVRNAITEQHGQVMASIDRLDSRTEERINHVYDALNPLAPRIAATSATLDNHLADHRAKREG
jgi:hypothetical protein